MKFDKALDDYLKEVYPPGTVIECIHMKDDPQAIPPFTRGVVTGTSGLGYIYMKWDTGSTLSLIFGVDAYKVIQEGV